jgi:hypothetical protein
MNTMNRILQIQLLAENILEQKRFKAPNGYFELVHQTLDDYASGKDEMEGLKDIPSHLSHPLRNMLVGLNPFQVMFGSLSTQEAAFVLVHVIESLSNPKIPFDKTVAFLIKEVESVKDIVEDKFSEQTKGAQRNTGVIMNLVGPHRFFLQGKPMFLVEQTLCEGLVHTNFGMDTPSQYLRSPLPYCYIEFGDKRDLDVSVYNELSGLHQVEGVYISEYPHDERMQSHLMAFLEARNAFNPNSANVRYIELEFTGSPIGKEHALDDATFNISLVIDDDAMLTVEEIYQLHVEYYQEMHETNQLFKATRIDDTTAQCFKPLLELLIKCLIFINCDLSTQVKVLDRTALEKQLNGLKNPAKRRKLQRKINSSKDYILVTSKDKIEYQSAASGVNGKMSAHWRRGHFRNQRYGEELSKTKILWIQPALIGVGSAQVKTYVVKSN